MRSAHLVRYEAARHALRVATQVDEVKDIRDKALALAEYARQAKDTELMDNCNKLKLRAERRIGELVAETELAKGGRPPKTDVEKSLNSTPNKTGETTAPVSPPTLAAIGLSKKQSSDFQAIAAIAEDKFEEIVATKKATTASLVRESPKKKANDAAKEKKPPKPKPPKAAPLPVDTVSKAQYDKLIDEYNELKDAHNEMAEELKAVSAFRSETAVKDLVVLEGKLKHCHRTRDELMGRTASMQKQIDTLTRKLKKDAK